LTFLDALIEQRILNPVPSKKAAINATTEALVTPKYKTRKMPIIIEAIIGDNISPKRADNSIGK